MTLPPNFNPYTMELELTPAESKKLSSSKEDRITDEPQKNTPKDKLAKVRAKLQPKDTKKQPVDDKKELSATIQAPIEQNTNNAGNNNAIASIARISKLQDPRS